LRIFKTKWFSGFAKKNDIDDISLINAIDDIMNGLIDADLGNGLIKQRIARKGKGKSGGFRTIIVIKQGNWAIFAAGFSKSDRDNIARDELLDLRTSAHNYLTLSANHFEQLIIMGELKEINNDKTIP
jgi:hypothetical protein